VLKPDYMQASLHGHELGFTSRILVYCIAFELPPVGRAPRKGVHSIIANKRGDRDVHTTNLHEGVQDRGCRAGRQDP
jgi:hypothetical protein